MLAFITGPSFLWSKLTLDGEGASKAAQREESKQLHVLRGNWGQGNDNCSLLCNKCNKPSFLHFCWFDRSIGKRFDEKWCANCKGGSWRVVGADCGLGIETSIRRMEVLPKKGTLPIPAEIVPFHYALRRQVPFLGLFSRDLTAQKPSLGAEFKTSPKSQKLFHPSGLANFSCPKRCGSCATCKVGRCLNKFFYFCCLHIFFKLLLIFINL